MGTVTRSAFRPAWWLRSPHAQTLWPALVHRRLHPRLERERLELADGDFLDIDWSVSSGDRLVVLLHGLEGSSRSPYVRGMLAAIADRGWRALVMHFRGCSGQPNRLARSYHSGDTGDLDFLMRTLERRTPAAEIGAIGYSLGGNVLLKWLGEVGEDAPIAAGVAVSAPMVLSQCAARLERGFSRLYQWRLLEGLRAKIEHKLTEREMPIDIETLTRLRTFTSFDDRVTAPLHGFASAEEYYRLASSRAYLGRIRRPTLILQSEDDPFMSGAVIPAPCELSSEVRLELSSHGGHVGFIRGHIPGRARYWLEERIPEFLAAHWSGASPRIRARLTAAECGGNRSAPSG